MCAAAANGPGSSVAQGTQHAEALRDLRSKVTLLSRELANLSQERDLLLEYVLGSAGGTGTLPQQATIQRIFSERQAQLSMNHTGAVPHSLQRFLEHQPRGWNASWALVHNLTFGAVCSNGSECQGGSGWPSRQAYLRRLVSATRGEAGSHQADRPGVEAHIHLWTRCSRCACRCSRFAGERRCELPPYLQQPQALQSICNRKCCNPQAQQKSACRWWRHPRRCHRQSSPGQADGRPTRNCRHQAAAREQRASAHRAFSAAGCRAAGLRTAASDARKI